MTGIFVTLRSIVFCLVSLGSGLDWVGFGSSSLASYHADGDSCKFPPGQVLLIARTTVSFRPHIFFRSSLLLSRHFFPFSCSLPRRNSDPGSLIRLFSPLPTTVHAFVFIATRLGPFLFSSARSELRYRLGKPIRGIHRCLPQLLRFALFPPFFSVFFLVVPCNNFTNIYLIHCICHVPLETPSAGLPRVGTVRVGADRGRV